METNSELKTLLPQLTNAILTLAKAISQTEPSPESQKVGEKMMNPQNPNQTNTEAQSKSPVTFAQLQSKLIDLSCSGMQQSIRALLNYYGVKRLTELPMEKYEELYEEVSKW